MAGLCRYDSISTLTSLLSSLKGPYGPRCENTNKIAIGSLLPAIDTHKNKINFEVSI